ncbi:hypothetical protein [Solicola sp. PLA-1-18]|uniref:hypothetical protein n=1 Tax=Solicola sp. PLA-1-18 TaxID=3380532 RepID=UPI003B7743C1
MATRTAAPPLDAGATSTSRAHDRRVLGTLARLPTHTTVALLALVAVCARVPFLGRPVGADEGGFLLVGSQWRAGGTSLYGDYWVDRPPLLIGLFGAAAHLGGPVALRLLGCLAAAAVVVLAGVVGHQVRGRPGARWAALVAAALVTSPMLDGQEVNGELLGIGFVLGSFALTLAATSRRRWSSQLVSAAGAGALAMAAVLVKQNLLDGFVFALVLLVVLVATGRLAPRAAALVAGTAALAAGTAALAATLVLLVVLGWAESRGTSPQALWNALVVFRAQAASVISTSASPATGIRLGRILVAAAGSGLAALVATLLLAGVRRRGRTAPAVAAAAVLGWDLFSVLAGGSYWLHYLVQLVPAAALAAATTTVGRDLWGRTGRACAGWVVGASVVATVIGIASPPAHSAPTVTAGWLRAAARPGDSAVVAFGQPGLLYRSGLGSPYPQIWSLPVRVRDPHLTGLTSVLDGTGPPTWVLVWHDRLGSWGITGTTARTALTTHYRPVADVCGYATYLRRGVDRPLPVAPTTCPAPAPLAVPSPQEPS